MGLLLTILWLLPVLGRAARLTLQSPRFSVIGPDGDTLRNEPLSLARPPSPPVVLGQSDALKLSFQVLEKDSGTGVQPHQTFLRFHDAHANEEGVQPLRVTSAGKASFELSMSRPPASIPPTPNTSIPLRVTLIVGSFKHQPLSQPLFDLYLPASFPPPEHPDEPSFHVQPEIHHTFRPEPKTPNVVFSAAGTVLVLAPWIVLLALWSSVPHRLPHILHPLILLFTGLLAAFEALLFVYWVKLRLGQVLLFGAILGSVTIAAGKSALERIGRWRVGAP